MAEVVCVTYLGQPASTKTRTSQGQRSLLGMGEERYQEETFEFKSPHLQRHYMLYESRHSTEQPDCSEYEFGEDRKVEGVSFA